MNVPDKVEEVFGPSRIIGWQFAADGAWEDAKRILSTNPNIDQIQEWLKSQLTKNIAFEVLLEFETGEQFFLGIRLNAFRPEDQIKVIQAVLKQNQIGYSLTQLISNLASYFNDIHFAANVPDQLELGVFDLWNRVKPLTIWRKEVNSILPFAKIPELASNPDQDFVPLYEPQDRAIMIEAVWKSADPHYDYWIGLPVSEFDKTLSKHKISEERYLSTAKILAGKEAGVIR